MLFRLFSFLADKTDGAKIFAKPKILLGTLLLGGIVVACKPKAAQTDCYVMPAEPDKGDTAECYKVAVKCYEDVVVPDTAYNAIDSFKKYMVPMTALCYDTTVLSADTVEPAANPDVPDSTVEVDYSTCYDAVYVPEE